MKLAVLASLFVVCATCPAKAWWPGGHDIITVAAVKATPEVPDFFKQGAGFIAHVSYDPDLAKNWGTPLARGAEHGEHYLDVELLKGRKLPATRYEFIRLCQELDVKPEGIGLVPYAVSEWTERLAVAFAEHRKWPDNPYIQSKCQVYAGILSHYAQDACEPLHLTVDFNGRKDFDGKVHLGDVVRADFVALDDGEIEIADQEPDNRSIQIGGRNSNKDLDGQLLGMVVGETRDVKYTEYEEQEDGVPVDREVRFRVTARKISEQKGIHEKVDALPESLEMDVATLSAGHTIEPADSLMAVVVGQVLRGFELVERVYELGPRMLKYGQKDWERDEEVVSFAVERARESVRFTASLYLTAWRRSASLKLPGWLDRSKDTQTQE